MIFLISSSFLSWDSSPDKASLHLYNTVGYSGYFITLFV